MLSQTLPMVAMFMKNKALSWLAVFFALQTYLTEPINKAPSNKDAAAQPPFLRFAFGIVSLCMCYLDFFFPATSGTLRVGRLFGNVSEAASTVAATATGIVSDATNTL